MLTKFTEEFKTALDKAITKNISDEKAEKGDKHKKEHVKDVLGKTLRHVSTYSAIIPISSAFDKH